MRAIKKEDLHNIIYYQTPKWLFDLLLDGKITAGAYATYILMYDRTRLSAKNSWIDDNGDVYIKYSYDDMKEDLKVKSNTQIQRNLNKLKELNLIDSKRNFNSSNTYYLNIYSLTQNVSNSLTQNVSNSLTQNVETNKNNLINNNKIRTTIKEPEKSSSSLEIYLKEKGYDSKTISNISKLDVALERVKEVITHADKNNMGIGYIVDALKNRYEIPKGKQQPKKELSGRRSSAVLGEKELECSMSSEEREHKRLESEVYKIIKKEDTTLRNEFFKAAGTLKTLKEFIEKQNLKVS